MNIPARAIVNRVDEVLTGRAAGSQAQQPTPARWDVLSISPFLHVLAKNMNSSREQPSGKLVTFGLPDSTSVERQALIYPDRALIEPVWAAGCTAAAEELY